MHKLSLNNSGNYFYSNTCLHSTKLTTKMDEAHREPRTRRSSLEFRRPHAPRPLTPGTGTPCVFRMKWNSKIVRSTDQRCSPHRTSFKTLISFGDWISTNQLPSSATSTMTIITDNSLTSTTTTDDTRHAFYTTYFICNLQMGPAMTP